MDFRTTRIIFVLPDKPSPPRPGCALGFKIGDRDRRGTARQKFRADRFVEFPISAYRTLTGTVLCRPNPAKFLHKSLILNGAPGEIRTPDPQIRSLVLYPAELRARIRLSRAMEREKRRGRLAVFLGAGKRKLAGARGEAVGARRHRGEPSGLTDARRRRRDPGAKKPRRPPGLSHRLRLLAMTDRLWKRTSVPDHGVLKNRHFLAKWADPWSTVQTIGATGGLVAGREGERDFSCASAHLV
jgi:hypothetical protein